MNSSLAFSRDVSLGRLCFKQLLWRKQFLTVIDKTALMHVWALVWLGYLLHSLCLSVYLSVSLSLAKRFVFYQKKKNEKQRGVPTQYLFYTQMTLKQSCWCSRWLVYKQLPSCSLTHCSQTPAAAPTKSFNYYILQNISVNWSSLCVVNQRFWGIHEILIKYSQSPSGYG